MHHQLVGYTFFSLDVTRTGGVDSAMAIQRAAQEHLTSLIPKVCESDMQVAELERQVRELKAKVQEQQLTKRPRINGETCERIAKVSEQNLVFKKYATCIFREEAYFLLNSCFGKNLLV